MHSHLLKHARETLFGVAQFPPRRIFNSHKLAA
jgi:hypothetical protein